VIYDILTGKSESKLNYKRGKPPDKRRHQMEMNHYTELIQKKEALFVSFASYLYRYISSVLCNVISGQRFCIFHIFSTACHD
jgi:hypothetical protein